MATQDHPVAEVRIDRIVTYLLWCRSIVWALCVGGFAMGAFISQAHQIRSAKFTVLGGLAGWPEVWGYTLMALGAVSLVGRSIGRRSICVKGRKIIDGNDIASAGMFGMALWYVIFACSLILGTAEYGFVPYLTLAGLHGIVAMLVHQTQGLRPSSVRVAAT